MLGPINHDGNMLATGLVERFTLQREIFLVAFPQEGTGDAGFASFRPGPVRTKAVVDVDVDAMLEDHHRATWVNLGSSVRKNSLADRILQEDRQPANAV